MKFTAEEQNDFDFLAQKTFAEFTDEELDRFRGYVSRQHLMDEADGWANFRRSTEAAQRRIGEYDIYAEYKANWRRAARENE